MRDHYENEKTVRRYERERPLEDLEKEFEYCSDEESVYEGFEQDPKKLPPSITKKFAINYESAPNKVLVRDMIKRFR